jgi:hypothetical protein
MQQKYLFVSHPKKEKEKRQAITLFDPLPS